jgi:enolase
MDARTLENKMNYLGMERAARKVLVDEKLAKAEEVAVMTCVEVCRKLLESYEVVSCEDEKITIVKKEDMKTYNDVVRFLSR